MPHYKEYMVEARDRIFYLFYTDKLKVAVDPTQFQDTESIPDAVEYLISGQNCGKVLSSTILVYIQSEMRMTQDSENTLKVARQAFENLTHGMATGKWEPLLDMLTEDFTLWFPMGKFHGLNVGKERAREFFEYVFESFSPGLNLTSLDHVTSNETTAVFEFRDEGPLFGQPYKNRVAVSFDVRGDKISGYREYFGSDGKSY